MDLDRRRFLTSTLGLAALSALPLRLSATAAPAPRVILFDAFPVFDPRPIFGQVKAMFPAEGDALVELWRTKQFEYTWLRTVMGRYEDFWLVTRDALRFAAQARKVELSAEQEDRLMGAYLNLKPWPDAPDALHKLKGSGIKLAFLSNFTAAMLDANIKGSGLDGLFDQVLSTDAAQAFKPDPRAYQLGVDAFGFKREEMLFASFAGWDTAGAKTFGYPTFWVNRLGSPAEGLDAPADAAGGSLTDLARFALA